MEKKKLIPAYNSRDKVTEKYIKDTTRTDNPLQVKRILFNFKNAYAKEQVVCDVIDKIIYNENLLNKVAIVNNLTYRNCKLIISDTDVTAVNTGGYSNLNPNYKYTELLKYFEERAEKIFILLGDEVKETSSKIIGIDVASPVSLIQTIFDKDYLSDAINQREKYIEKLQDKELNIAMLKGELIAINEKINECLDASLDNTCKEKKYFYKTMFNNLCRERDKIKYKLNNLNE